MIGQHGTDKIQYHRKISDIFRNIKSTLFTTFLVVMKRSLTFVPNSEEKRIFFQFQDKRAVSDKPK